MLLEADVVQQKNNKGVKLANRMVGLVLFDVHHVCVHQVHRLEELQVVDAAH